MAKLTEAQIAERFMRAAHRDLQNAEMRLHEAEESLTSMRFLHLADRVRHLRTLVIAVEGMTGQERENVRLTIEGSV